MKRGRVTELHRPINFAMVLVIYFAACLLSTTGVDVLVLLTATLIMWATVRQFGSAVLAAVLATLLGALGR